MMQLIIICNGWICQSEPAIPKSGGGGMLLLETSSLPMQ